MYVTGILEKPSSMDTALTKNLISDSVFSLCKTCHIVCIQWEIQFVLVIDFKNALKTVYDYSSKYSLFQMTNSGF